MERTEHILAHAILKDLIDTIGLQEVKNIIEDIHDAELAEPFAWERIFADFSAAACDFARETQFMKTHTPNEE